MIIKAYLHSSKEEMYDLAKEHGLSDPAAREFTRALYEVEFLLDVDPQTGTYKIIKAEEV